MESSGTKPKDLEQTYMLVTLHHGLTRALASLKNRIEALNRGDDVVDEATWAQYLVWRNRLTEMRAEIKAEMNIRKSWHLPYSKRLKSLLWLRCQCFLKKR